MPYIASWINRFAQFQIVSYGLILADSENIRPRLRIGKTIRASNDNATTRDRLAADEIALVVFEQDHPAPKVKTCEERVAELELLLREQNR